MKIKRRLSRFLLHLFYRKLWVKIAIVLFVIVTISLALMWVLLINTSSRALKDSVLNNYKEIASRSAYQISLYMGRAEDVLNATQAMLSVVYPAVWKQETVLVELVLNQPIFMRAVSVDLEGNIIASSELGRGLKWEYPPEALLKTRERKTYISEVKILNNNIPYVTMAVPIKKMSQVIGVLIADVNLRGVWDIVDNIRLGKSGSAFLVSQDGTLIAHQDKKKVLKKISLSSEKNVQAVLSGKTEAVEIADSYGKKLVSAYAPVVGLNWGVVLQQRQEEAYLFSGILKTQSLIIIILSEIVAVLASIFLGQRLTRPIETLLDRIKSISEGDLEERIKIKRRDEIGELIRSFNNMTLKLKQSRDQIRLSAVGVTASWIAHELKNSLMVVKSFVQLFPSEHAHKRFVEKFSKLVPEEIRRWERMLNELSDLSSQVELKVSRTDLNMLLSSTLEITEEKLKEKNITFNYIPCNEKIYVMADSDRLKQVFLNLIFNAMNAMPDGGSLTVSMDLLRNEGLNNLQRTVEIRIKDTGIGLSPGEHNKIFEPFYTHSRNRNGGMGLGLAVSRKIVQQHRGSIDVESEIGKGAIFIIRLPAEIPSVTDV